MLHRLIRLSGFTLPCLMAGLLSAVPASAQFAAPPGGTQVLDSAALKPPAGARVAIVEFDDLQCPACATANPILMRAAAQYHIPWIRHDFLIPYHTWSLTAAITARYFDTRSAALGDEYRNQVFANQTYIFNPMVLRQFNENFARSHGITLPSEMDPQGKLAAEVQADNELSKQTGIHHTPTIFVVAAHSKGAPFVEVMNPSQDLDQIIEQALVDTTPAQTAKNTKTAHK
jgi:protein-disulfide isomerase